MVNSPAPVCSTHCTPGPDRLPFTWAKPVGPRFGQMVRKIQDWLISSRNRVYYLYKSVSFSEKRPRRREDDVKDDFEKMEHEFPFGTFRPEK